jgi:glycerol kinase
MADFVAAIDQGTTSTRCMIFDHSGREVAKYQLEHQQIMPQAGWVEHDPREIWERTQEVVQQALARRGLAAGDLVGLGITNQRETVVAWDREATSGNGDPGVIVRAIGWNPQGPAQAQGYFVTGDVVVEDDVVA